MVEMFHAKGARVAIHYNKSKDTAESLASRLNDTRPNSAFAVQADLADYDSIQAMMKIVLEKFDNRLSLLVNNASTFYETPIESLTKAQAYDLMHSNYFGPLFITQACVGALRNAGDGLVINLIDINTRAPPP